MTSPIYSRGYTDVLLSLGLEKIAARPGGVLNLFRRGAKALPNAAAQARALEEMGMAGGAFRIPEQAAHMVPKAPPSLSANKLWEMPPEMQVRPSPAEFGQQLGWAPKTGPSNLQQFESRLDPKHFAPVAEVPPTASAGPAAAAPAAPVEQAAAAPEAVSKGLLSRIPTRAKVIGGGAGILGLGYLGNEALNSRPAPPPQSYYDTPLGPEYPQ